jgi:hypothetical protein
VQDGVIHMLQVRLKCGTEATYPSNPPLGQCFGLMPRWLWDRVRNEYEWSRPDPRRPYLDVLAPAGIFES